MAYSPFQLNKRANIGSVDTIQNEATGSYIKQFVPQFSRWCAVKLRTMNQTYQLVSMQLQDTVDLIFRHDPLLQSSLQIQLEGVIYNILSVSPDESTDLERYDIVTIEKITKAGSTTNG
ncbi:phage head closure protein [Oenococcus oeni]|uniref:phage head closure protein n=1 Tax=Oenococcus oeni TaxID=1247 RepID=UPI0010B83241|nr:phage head closure protein [Oenococcus oeni]SYW19482.1 conserved hypothetical protein [Oenococcus oeni]